jgi:hypothetical protein
MLGARFLSSRARPAGRCDADDIRTRRALDQKPCLRGIAYRAKSWHIDLA